MPKFYCDYCDVFLTHDSPSVRKTHCTGSKHKASVKQWYQQFEVDIIQELIDLKVREYEARMGIRAPPGGMPPGGIPAAPARW